MRPPSQAHWSANAGRRWSKCSLNSTQLALRGQRRIRRACSRKSGSRSILTASRYKMQAIPPSRALHKARRRSLRIRNHRINYSAGCLDAGFDDRCCDADGCAGYCHDRTPTAQKCSHQYQGLCEAADNWFHWVSPLGFGQCCGPKVLQMLPARIGMLLLTKLRQHAPAGPAFPWRPGAKR